MKHLQDFELAPLDEATMSALAMIALEKADDLSQIELVTQDVYEAYMKAMIKIRELNEPFLQAHIQDEEQKHWGL